MQHTTPRSAGFTLIELSIVLVIIGLIVGGVLVGQDLIAAAAIRAQITQIEKYQTAVNTFRSKYNCMPGDCLDAANIGMPAITGVANEPNGDGLIQGATETSTPGRGVVEAGEAEYFWVHLSAAQLIEGNFSPVTYGTPCVIQATTGPVNNYCPDITISDIMPPAKLGNPKYVYVYSDDRNNKNYFGLSNVIMAGQEILGGYGIVTEGPAGLTPLQALAIDSKIDDGFPQSGGVIAQFLNGYYNDYPAFPGGDVYGNSGAPDQRATSPSQYNCYDNGGLGGQQHYSTEQDGGADNTCALSFVFQ